MTTNDTIDLIAEAQNLPQEMYLAARLEALPGAQEILRNAEHQNSGFSFELDTTAYTQKNGVEQHLAGYLCFNDQVHSVVQVKNSKNETYTLLMRYNPLAGKERRSTPELVIDGERKVTIEKTVKAETRNNVLYLSPARLDARAVFIPAKALNEEQKPPTEAAPKTPSVGNMVVRGILKAVTRRKQKNSTLTQSAINVSGNDDPNIWSAKTADALEFIDNYSKGKIEGIQMLVPEHTVQFANKRLKELIEGRSPQEASLLAGIIRKGNFDSYDIDAIWAVQRNGDRTMGARIKLAEITARSPQLGVEMAERHIVGFHGTRSSALAGVLREGFIGSGRHLREQEAFTMTGEHIFQSEKGQGSISFSTLDFIDDSTSRYAGNGSVKRKIEDLEASLRKMQEDYDEANSVYNLPEDNKFNRMQREVMKERARSLEYIKSHPDSIEAKLTLDDFAVVFGISNSYLEDLLDDPVNANKTTDEVIWRASSELGEFQVITPKIEKKAIPMIFVPEEKVGYVQELCKEYGFTDTIVRSIENIYK